MGAFDGYVRGFATGCGGTNREETYIKHQPAFHFYPGFGKKELQELLAEAQASDCDTVWVRTVRPGHGHIGLSTWYVAALLENLDD